MTVSVLMATYNGEKYIREQLDSIVPFLEEGDELIVSDDGSSDNTLDIAREYQKICQKIHITEGEHSGSSTNFVSAILKSGGEILLFCDQDDIWMPEKLNTIKRAFSDNPTIELIMHNAGFCDADGNVVKGDIFSRRHPKHGFMNNLVHSAYYGCCMAAKRSFLIQYVPLPDNSVPYDQYFSLIAEHKQSSFFLEDRLILHRYHGLNQSKRMKNIDRIQFRFNLWRNVWKALRRAL